jgi:uncharacterized Zn-finger protein
MLDSVLDDIESLEAEARGRRDKCTQSLPTWLEACSLPPQAPQSQSAEPDFMSLASTSIESECSTLAQRWTKSGERPSQAGVGPVASTSTATRVCANGTPPGQEPKPTKRDAEAKEAKRKTQVQKPPKAKETCIVCGKMVKNLAQHMGTHSARIHTCQVCNKSFTRMQYLQIHAATHREEKRFDCPECGRKFHDSANRRRHVKTQHEDKRRQEESAAERMESDVNPELLIFKYHCPCGMGFNTELGVEAHLRRCDIARAAERV